MAVLKRHSKPKKKDYRDKKRIWYEAKCEECNELYYPARPESKFCSQTCSYNSRVKKNKEENKKNKEENKANKPKFSNYFNDWGIFEPVGHNSQYLFKNYANQKIHDNLKSCGKESYERAEKNFNSKPLEYRKKYIEDWLTEREG